MQLANIPYWLIGSALPGCFYLLIRNHANSSCMDSRSSCYIHAFGT